MRKVAFALVAMLLILPEVSGQLKFGIKGGLSSVSLTPGDLIVLNEQDVDALKLEVEEAKLGYHLGLFFQARLGTFFLQPEALYNSSRVDYRITDLGDLTDDIFTEEYEHIDIPVMLGLTAGPIRLGAGPVGHILLSSKSELEDLPGFNDDFEKLTLGWQAGIGFDFWKLHVDARYEGNLTDFGDHITFHGKQYQFDESPSRLIASVGISF